MSVKHLIDPGHWRQADFSRPWYAKAFKLLPEVSNNSVLELGSGQGELADQLKTQVESLTCSDGSPIYINKLKAKGFKVVQVDYNHKLPFKAKQFHGAISLEVIEHLYNAEVFLKEIHRVLKPQGWLIISTPNIAWWGYRLFVLLGKPPKKEGYHLRFFTYNTFTKILKDSGFQIIKSTSFTTIPFLNRLLISLKLKPIYPIIKIGPNLLAQDLVFLCRKK